MGGHRHFGNLYHVKNIVYFRLANFELDPFKNFWSTSFRHIKGDFLRFGVFAVGAYALAHTVVHLADVVNERESRKKPGQFDHEQ
ncbi:uncharacterized protein LOC112538616 [Tetranychus urticae]|uniref:Cytochrome b-c1 complex subunit 8 n=1 Tax=Tetranychus urticae TaxID=32264 RepID=T1K2X0_TETUR|nr:uncharacterized protein LOC112538616 [Tetranychus urticae]